MEYRHCENRNFEDLACGRVIIHRTGFPNFPVRLAHEIFNRCMDYLGCPDDGCIYDPCCGGGYLLTVLGFLNTSVIKTIVASDINDDALLVARENLSLLNIPGLERRIQQLSSLFSQHNKASHLEAVDSAGRLLSIIKEAPHEIKCEAFNADILSDNPLRDKNFKADIVFVDVPYGNLVSWQRESVDFNLLDNLLPVLNEKSIVAICSDKSQKFKSEHFQSLEKQLIGKRKFQIFRPIF